MNCSFHVQADYSQKLSDMFLPWLTSVFTNERTTKQCEWLDHIITALFQTLPSHTSKDNSEKKKKKHYKCYTCQQVKTQYRNKLTVNNICPQCSSHKELGCAIFNPKNFTVIMIDQFWNELNSNINLWVKITPKVHWWHFSLFISFYSLCLAQPSRVCTAMQRNRFH